MRDDLINKLYEYKDDKYKTFNDKIVNTKLKTIGVRTPILRLISKETTKEDYELFFKSVKREYYEEVMIEGFLISKIKDPKILLQKLDKYINKIDNWAICDMVCASCKVLKNKDELAYSFVLKNIQSNNPWRVRFSYILLLDYLIKEPNLDNIFNLVEKYNNDFYYVKMAKAWLLSECYIKFPEHTLNYLKKSNLDNFTYNKSISKICDSYRVLKCDKIMLRKMKKK